MYVDNTMNLVYKDHFLLETPDVCRFQKAHISKEASTDKMNALTVKGLAKEWSG